jgi:hypothetical protein
MNDASSHERHSVNDRQYHDGNGCSSYAHNDIGSSGKTSTTAMASTAVMMATIAITTPKAWLATNSLGRIPMVFRQHNRSHHHHHHQSDPPSS